MTLKNLIVSVHDVTPAFEPEIRRILSFLANLGVREGALLVVPDFHGRWPLGQHSRFCHFLRELQSDGWEPVLHGFTHLDSDERAAQRLRDRLFRRHLTDGEGEFLLLDEGEARARLERGTELITDLLGTPPAGFVPPAWLCGPAASRALQKCGLRFTEDHLHIEDLRLRTRSLAPAVAWASRSLPRRYSSRAWARLAGPLMLPLSVARFAIHPVDFRHRSLISSIERAAQLFLESGFQPTTYTEYLE